MKLYTEEAIIELESQIKKIQYQSENDWQTGYQKALNDVLYMFNSLTLIELPSDEEIETESHNHYLKGQLYIEPASDTEYAFKKGAKWMKSKILGNNHLGGITY